MKIFAAEEASGEGLGSDESEHDRQDMETGRLMGL